MMTSDDIIDVNESDFEYEVVAYSQNVPVLVDFWAEWCRPCKTLGPLLEKLTVEFDGAFRLARVNVDDNPNLAMQFGVRTIPTVKIFTDGHVVQEFVGLQPESRLRDILSRITPPSPASLLLEKANSLAASHEWVEAEELFREILDQDSHNPEALLGLAKSLLGQNESHEALYILRSFPASRQFNSAELLQPLAQAMVEFRDRRLPEDHDLDPAFNNSIRLASRGNFEAALDGLLDSLHQDKSYRGGLARKVFLAILELMGEDDPQTRQYRNELSALLF